MYFPGRECKNLEFKENMPKGNALIRTCVAFANGVGGEIVIGVQDKTAVVTGASAADTEYLYESFPNSLFDSTLPAIIPEIMERNMGDRTVLIIKISQASKKPVCIRAEGIPAGVYVRVGSSTRKADESIVTELLREQARITYDGEITDAAIADLSESQLARIYGEHHSHETLIREKILLHNSMQQLKCSIGGLLCFGIAPDEFLPESLVRCTHFAGSAGRNIIQTVDICGSIPEIAERTHSLLCEWLERNPKLTHVELRGEAKLPLIAVREAIINALVHRKYSVAGAIKVALFDDRLEVFNPGCLPGSITIEHLGDGSTVLRNPMIAKFARKFRLMEKLGSGIRLMRELCRSSNLLDPEFIESGDSFKVVFSFMERTENAESTESKTLKLLEQNSRVSVSDVISELKVSRNTATNILNRLCKRGRAKRIGMGRGTYYIVCIDPA